MDNKINAEWFLNNATGIFTTRLKTNPDIYGTGKSRSAATRAFLKVCDDDGLPNDRKSYRIRKIKSD